MKQHQHLNFAKGLLWRKIVDSKGKHCGVVCDIEFDKEVGMALRANSMLAKSGISSRLLPLWLKFVYGSKIIKVDWSNIERIKKVVRLKLPIESLVAV